jgi:hypothetical protein
VVVLDAASHDRASTGLVIATAMAVILSAAFSRRAAFSGR